MDNGKENGNNYLGLFDPAVFQFEGLPIVIILLGRYKTMQAPFFTPHFVFESSNRESVV